MLHYTSNDVDTSANLDKRIIDAAASVRLEELSGISNYTDLLELPRETLAGLVRLEEAIVARNEASNEAVDSISGGHHRDVLSLLNSALEGVEFPDGCFVFMDEDDGELLFDFQSHKLNAKETIC